MPLDLPKSAKVQIRIWGIKAIGRELARIMHEGRRA